MARVPRTCIVDSRLPPLVWSLGRGTTILLPARLFNRLSPDRAAAVLAHELMHVRRRDHWVRWIEAIVVCVFWWHPVAWLARYRLQAAEERCCDADVLRALPQIRRGYAEALLETLDFLNGARPAALPATGFTQRSSVVRRFEMIVQTRPAARPLLSVRGLIFSVVLLILLASPVASPAHPEGQPEEWAADGIPCTVTLKDGTTMEGYIVRLADDRVVIRRRTERAVERIDKPTKPKTPTISDDHAKHEFWDLDLSECVSISLKNSDVIRQLNVSFADDKILLLGDERGESRLLDARGGVANLLRDVETAYWELWRGHRYLEAAKAGRDAALETWRGVYEAYKSGDEDAHAGREAQAKSQYFAFRGEVEALTADLLRNEDRLRYLLGLAGSAGRLIRPSDEPTMAQVEVQWDAILQEGLKNRVEILKHKWNVKQRELQLNAARNHLLPRLDSAGQYRWLGRGDEDVDDHGSGANKPKPAGNGRESHTDGDFQQWELGLQFNLPIGTRLPQAMVRHHQILFARERALLRDTELEVSHQIADALRDMHRDYRVAQSRFNGVIAAQQEVAALEQEYGLGVVTLDLLLDAQLRRVDAERNYYAAAADYALSIMRLHERKGSLLERHGASIAKR